MLKTLTTIVHAIWAACALSACTAIGAIYGFHRHGWIGAIALGFAGMCLGTLVAACPLECIGLLIDGL